MFLTLPRTFFSQWNFLRSPHVSSVMGKTLTIQQAVKGSKVKWYENIHKRRKSTYFFYKKCKTNYNEHKKTMTSTWLRVPFWDSHIKYVAGINLLVSAKAPTPQSRRVVGKYNNKTNYKNLLNSDLNLEISTEYKHLYNSDKRQQAAPISKEQSLFL